MELFFRVVTKTTAFANVVANRSRLRGALIVALAGLTCVGCVGRKQYAINEAILISERRQLEDEIYRLQFELRDALEENERLRQELGGADAATGANSPTSRTRARANANDAFFPGLDAAQIPLRTTGGAKNAETAPATGEAVETLPDYVPIPVTSTQRAPLPQNAQIARPLPTGPNARIAQSASSVSNDKTRLTRQGVSPAPATQAGKALGVRRVVPVAGSNESGGEVVASVFVDAPSEKAKSTSTRSTNADDWSPLTQ